MNQPVSSEYHNFQPEFEIIEVTDGDVFMADNEEQLVAANITSGTLVATYDPETNIGMLGHYEDTDAQHNEIKLQLTSALNFSDGHKVLFWGIDLPSPSAEKDNPVVVLDCKIGRLTVDGIDIEGQPLTS